LGIYIRLDLAIVSTNLAKLIQWSSKPEGLGLVGARVLWPGHDPKIQMHEPVKKIRQKRKKEKGEGGEGEGLVGANAHGSCNHLIPFQRNIPGKLFHNASTSQYLSMDAYLH
jgi:hypothetical protein